MSDSLKEQLLHSNPAQDELASAVINPPKPGVTAPDRLPGKPITLMVSGAPSKLDPATVLQAATIERIKAIIARYPVARSALLPALHVAQEEQGWLPPAYLAAVATMVGISASEVEEVASFYNMFYLKPIGKNIVKVCTSISCYLCGSDVALARLERELGVKRGETSADGNITLLAAECLAACGDAPVAQLNDEFVGKLTDEVVAGLVGKLKQTL